MSMTKKFHVLTALFALSAATANAQFDAPEDFDFGSDRTTATSIIELEEPPETRNPIDQEAELVRQRFANGKVHIERWVAESPEGDFVNHGTFTEYNTKGETIVSGEYRMGRRDGTWSKQIPLAAAQQLTKTIDRGFVPPFLSKAEFADGSLTGDWTLADTRGSLVFVLSFERGKRNGVSSYFNSRGEVIRTISYVDNLADGPAKLSLRKDQPVKDIQFTNGMMMDTAEEYYPQVRGKKRVLKSQEEVLVPTPINLESHDWDKNIIRFRKYESAEKVRHGRSITFYANGQRESEGQYEQGNRTGTFVWWYSNGQQKTIGEYKNDETQGRWTWWHENGMREARADFLNGVRKSALSVWDQTGRLVKRTPANLDIEQVATQPPRVNAEEEAGELR